MGISKLKHTFGAFGLLFYFSHVFVGCSKNLDVPCVPGLGGSVTLVLKPEHHGDPIVSTISYPDSAFIKFNATEFPGSSPSAYDLIVVGTEGADSVIVENLSCGNYFIYMTGLDTGVQEVVKGGIPVNITNSFGTFTLTIPITE